MLTFLASASPSLDGFHDDTSPPCPAFWDGTTRCCGYLHTTPRAPLADTSSLAVVLMSTAFAACTPGALAARARVSPSASALTRLCAVRSTRSSKRRVGLAVRADGGSGINFAGFPYVIARKAGFDTSEGIAGFTPFAELFIGRTAMGGFATGLAQELITGDGILAQLGFRDTPSPALFDFLVAFLASTTLIGCAVTFRQLTSGEMSPKQFRRYQSFLGLTAKDEAERVAATREAQSRDADGAALASEFAAVASAIIAGPNGEMSMDEDPELTPKEVANGSMAYLKSVELNNARWAMVGFATAIVMEAKTGGGIVPQLITYGKMSGMLGADSGF